MVNLLLFLVVRCLRYTLGERDRGEIVESSVAMLSRWTDIDVGAAGIAVLEQGELFNSATLSL
jgi:hypothetical protein